MNNTKIVKIELIETGIIRRKTEIEQERNIAIGDLLSDNYFALFNHIGGYELQLGIIDGKLNIFVSGENMLKDYSINIAISQFRAIIKDYYIICESYFAVSASKDPYRLETIDMARRAIHNEGAELFKSEISDYADLDFDTARRLFTLMCVMLAR